MPFLTLMSYFVGDSKSTSQKLSDTTRSGADDAQSGGKSYLESAQGLVSNAASTISDTLSGKFSTSDVILAED